MSNKFLSNSKKFVYSFLRDEKLWWGSMGVGGKWLFYVILCLAASHVKLVKHMRQHRSKKGTVNTDWHTGTDEPQQVKDTFAKHNHWLQDTSVSYTLFKLSWFIKRYYQQNFFFRDDNIISVPFYWYYLLYHGHLNALFGFEYLS